MNFEKSTNILPITISFLIFLFSRALKEVFKNLFMRGHSHYDRQLRNDILVITTIIAQNPGAPMIVSMHRIAFSLLGKVVRVV